VSAGDNFPCKPNFGTAQQISLTYAHTEQENPGVGFMPVCTNFLVNIFQILTSGCCTEHNKLMSCFPCSHLSSCNRTLLCMINQLGFGRREDGQAHLLWNCKTEHSLGFACCNFYHSGGRVGHCLCDLKGHVKYTELSAFLLNPHC